MNEVNRVGTYTISITAVVVNGVTYDVTSLVQPGYFILTVDGGCLTTVVTATSVAAITLQLWDAITYYPLSGAAFTDFSDSFSAS